MSVFFQKGNSFFLNSFVLTEKICFKFCLECFIFHLLQRSNIVIRYWRKFINSWSVHWRAMWLQSPFTVAFMLVLHRLKAYHNAPDVTRHFWGFKNQVLHVICIKYNFAALPVWVPLPIMASQVHNNWHTIGLPYPHPFKDIKSPAKSRELQILLSKAIFDRIKKIKSQETKSEP